MMRSKHAASIALVLGICLLWAVSVPAGPADSVIVVIPLEGALSDPALASHSGIVVSPESVMVVLPETLVATLLGEPGPWIERRSGVALWIAVGRIPEGAVDEAGARVLYGGELSTVVEADPASAGELVNRGFTLSELRLSPLSALMKPSLGEVMLDEFLGRRPLTDARARFMSGLADSVDTLEIWRTIDELAYDRDREVYRSRYSCREDLREHARPLIVDRLTSYLAPCGGEVRVAPCLPASWMCPDRPPENIVADLPGKKTAAHYIICAHYDATASREPGWDWETEPAPGADDNATGVAVLVECARLLAPLELDIGLKFVAFSGEEQGLKGSKCYADSIRLLSDSDSLLGVINIDMVGYVEGGEPVLTLAYDWKSKWLSDQLVEASVIAGSETEIEQVNLTGIPMSDHFAFWQMGIPGVMFIEELEGLVPANPNYHTFGDTLGLLSMGPVGDNAGIVVSFLSRFAPLPEDTLADMELTEGSIEWDWDGRGRGDLPVAGNSIATTLRALNLGASMNESHPYIYEIRQGPWDTGRLVHNSTETLQLLSGEHTDIEVSWQADPGAYGAVSYSFSLMPMWEGVESDLSNNKVDVSIETMARTVILENLHVFPNPMISIAEASLAFYIYHPDGDFDGVIDIWIYEMLGRRIGYGRLERSPAKSEIDVGYNAVDLSDFLSAGEAMPPGLYLVVAELRLLHSTTYIGDKFRFAVDR